MPAKKKATPQTKSRTTARASSKKSAAATSKRTTRTSPRTSAGHAAHALIGHEEIRQWAEERGATPVCVRRTGGRGDVGMIRLDFPGYGGEESLQEISWDEWFDKFDERNLALMVQETTARGQLSNFNKLVSRETVEAARKPKVRTARG